MSEPLKHVAEDPIQDLRILVLYAAFNHPLLNAAITHQADSSRAASLYLAGRQYLSGDTNENLAFSVRRRGADRDGVIAQMDIRHKEIFQGHVVLLDNGGVHYGEMNEKCEFVEGGEIAPEKAAELHARFTQVLQEISLTLS